MKIALVADSFPPFISGVTTHNVEFISHALKQGHELLVFIPRYKDQSIPDTVKDATYITMRSAKAPFKDLRINYPNPAKVAYQLQKFKPDVIWCNTASFTGIDALMAAKMLNVPTVATFHTLYTSKEYLQMLLRMKQTFVFEMTGWAYNRWFYNACDHVFVSTDGMKQYLVKHGIHEEKISTSPILFNNDVTTFDEKNVKKIKEKYSLKKNVAVYLGRVSQEKSLDKLIDAWKSVVHQNNDTTLLIIGGGSYESTLQDQIEENNLVEHVVLTGFMEHETLMSSGILYAADCYVTASTSETWGIATLEAMAHGLPVVIAKGMGVAEILNGAGFVCDKANIPCFTKHILEIFENENTKDELGDTAREITEKYSGETGTKTIITQFENFI